MQYINMQGPDRARGKTGWRYTLPALRYDDILGKT
jgi:hypothetical protein